ncbi:MAG: NAD(P)/FAD-dependent oxidoreductase [Sediminicola sp.]|tara:strand:+ start:56321 stop:57670 length:1350 start_codon:yes stop_codon:yes gene_type:complete
MKNKEFDVFVIGSGAAGQSVALQCAKAGLSVAITDKREYGGTCANRGCDPKKVLLGATEVMEMATRLKGKGVKDIPRLDWKALQKFKKDFTKNVPKGTEKKLDELGITRYHGVPKFLDNDTLEVASVRIKAEKIVIATGYRTRDLEIEGGHLLNDSEDFLNLKKMPRSVIFIGAGYIGMEFAHMAARAGSKVTVIDHGDRPLSAFDGDMVDHLLKVSKELGIRFIANGNVRTAVAKGKAVKITYDQNGKETSLKALKVFNTSGRVPSIEGLSLETANIDFGKRGITVNDYLQSKGNDRVYACGDVSNTGLPLTPLTGKQASVVAQNIINGNKTTAQFGPVPSVVFTLPNLASVGLSEAEARKRFKNVLIKSGSATDWFSAKRINAPAYAYKTLVNERNGKILGAHLLGPEAAETINLFAMAIGLDLTAEEFKNMVFTYPTWANDIQYMF